MSNAPRSTHCTHGLPRSSVCPECEELVPTERKEPTFQGSANRELCTHGVEPGVICKECSPDWDKQKHHLHHSMPGMKVKLPDDVSVPYQFIRDLNKIPRIVCGSGSCIKNAPFVAAELKWKCDCGWSESLYEVFTHSAQIVMPPVILGAHNVDVPGTIEKILDEPNIQGTIEGAAIRPLLLEADEVEVRGRVSIPYKDFSELTIIMDFAKRLRRSHD